MKNRHTHLDVITALRGIAALGVVFFHVRIFLWVGWNEIQSSPHEYSRFDHFASWFSIPTPFLGEGVLLFFVISGFCIHFPQVGKPQNLNIRQYAVRRFFRIYPPYAIAIGFSMLAVYCLPWADISQQSWIQSLCLIQNYFPSANSQITSNMSLWSIPTEVEFYIAYPMMLILANRFGVFPSVLLLITVTIISVVLYFYGNTRLAFSSFTFYIFWWSGAVLADLYAKNKLPFPGAIPFLLAVACLTVGLLQYVFKFTPFLSSRLFFGIFCVLLLWFSISYFSDIAFNDFKLGKIILILGEMSYSLYLIHYPLLQIFGYIWVEEYGSKPTNFFVPVMFVLFSVLCAYVFYCLFEKPFHVLGKKLSAKV